MTSPWRKNKAIMKRVGLPTGSSIRAAAVGLAALFLLAGCFGASGKGKGGADEEGPDFDDLDLDATKDTGIIRGVVVDDAIRPIVDAELSLAIPGEAPRTAKTSETGAFGYSGLDPGTYFIKAHKLGYRDAQASVEVVAGEDRPPVERILLEADPASTPYHDERVFEGFIECSGTFVVVGVALCSVPNVITNFLGLGNVTNDRFLVEYDVAARPMWLQSEMVWESTQQLGDKMAVMYSWDCGDENGGFLCDHEVAGTSPLLLVANETAIQEINEGQLGNGTQLMIRVFNRGLDETMGRVGMTLEQEFEIYSHFFYGYEPPEGWRFTVDGAPPPPE